MTTTDAFLSQFQQQQIVTYLQAAIGIPLFYFLVLPKILAVLPKKAQFLAKCIIVLLATLIMSVAGCFISIACALVNKRYIINYVVSRFFGILAAGPCGVTYKVVGEEKLENYPAIVVCNHQSSMDMMVLGRVFPKHCVVMAKKELLYFPFLGVFSKLFVFILSCIAIVPWDTHTVSRVTMMMVAMIVFVGQIQWRKNKTRKKNWQRHRQARLLHRTSTPFQEECIAMESLKTSGKKIDKQTDSYPSTGRAGEH